MNPSVPKIPAASPDASPAHSRQEEADGRDFAEFIAGQAPLDAAAASWLVRRQDGMTPEEEAEFEEWLAADSAHVEALEQMEEVWGRMDELPDEGVDALKAGLASGRADGTPPSQAASPVPEASRPQRPQPASSGRRAWFLDLGRLVPQAAAAAVAFAIVGGGWYGWDAWQHRPTFTQSFATQRGQQQEVNLPDGSTLWLDTATQVDVALYRQRREVRLSEGQVLFAVQADPEQPFDVFAGATRVTVVGTRFSVRRTHSGVSDEGSVRVVVEQGRVRVASHADTAREFAVSGADAGNTVELGAGQSATADAAGALGPVGSDAPAPAAWREGRINFNGATLAQALAEFERYGNTGLVIHDPAVAALKVQGSFDLSHVGTFTRALPQVLPVQLKPTDGGKTEIVARR